MTGDINVYIIGTCICFILLMLEWVLLDIRNAIKDTKRMIGNYYTREMWKDYQPEIDAAESHTEMLGIKAYVLDKVSIDIWERVSRKNIYRDALEGLNNSDEDETTEET